MFFFLNGEKTQDSSSAELVERFCDQEQSVGIVRWKSRNQEKDYNIASRVALITTMVVWREGKSTLQSRDGISG